MRRPASPKAALLEIIEDFEHPAEPVIRQRQLALRQHLQLVLSLPNDELLHAVTERE
jgi:hypothetical protein